VLSVICGELQETGLPMDDQRKGRFSRDIPTELEILWWNKLAEIARQRAVSSI
jgi:hypothetical protein